ncbi:MAG: LytTR family DNA-binding domain-containing protein [Bacteroidia bacterium]
MNCIIVDDDELVRHTLETLIAETDYLTFVKSCSTAAEAAEILQQESIDLIFLDVKMPGMNGIDFLKSLEENKPQVIMITADKDSAAEAYNLDASDFILKPITRPRFLKAVAKTKRNFTLNQKLIASDALFVKVNSVLRRVNMHDIIYIEAMADYLTVHTATQKYVLKSTMKNIMDKLPEKEFIRVHNSFIVRIDKITSIEDVSLLIGKKIIPISRNRRKSLMDSLNII